MHIAKLLTAATAFQAADLGSQPNEVPAIALLAQRSGSNNDAAELLGVRDPNEISPYSHQDYKRSAVVHYRYQPGPPLSDSAILDYKAEIDRMEKEWKQERLPKHETEPVFSASGRQIHFLEVVVMNLIDSIFTKDHMEDLMNGPPCKQKFRRHSKFLSQWIIFDSYVSDIPTYEVCSRDQRAVWLKTLDKLKEEMDANLIEYERNTDAFVLLWPLRVSKRLQWGNRTFDVKIFTLFHFHTKVDFQKVKKQVQAPDFFEK